MTCVTASVIRSTPQSWAHLNIASKHRCPNVSQPTELNGSTLHSLSRSTWATSSFPACLPACCCNVIQRNSSWACSTYQMMTFWNNSSFLLSVNYKVSCCYYSILLGDKKRDILSSECSEKFVLLWQIKNGAFFCPLNLGNNLAKP